MKQVIFLRLLNNINIQMIKFSLFGETILEWNDKDIEHYHAQRMAMDSMLCRFKATYPAERIDSVRHLLEDKERQMCQIVQILEQQQAINDKIPRQVPVIAQKSVQEQPKKPKRKGFLGIFGKKEEAKPTVTTTMHRSFNRNMRTEQQAQSRRLSVHADSLAARNAELNRQLQGLVVQIDGKVQTDLQKREAEITAMRERSFIQIGGLTGFVILLLVISYIIIHRNANRIKRYKQETADLIERLQQMAKRNEALIASRKKAVHTITHELRTPLTAITGYAGLMRKDCNTDKTGTYIRNIQESSDRMREMLNTLLNFFRLDNGKEQPNFSACRISAITHTLETEFMPIAAVAAGTVDILATLAGKFARCTVQVDNVKLSMKTSSYMILPRSKPINIESNIDANFELDYSKLSFSYSDPEVATIGSDLYIETHGKKGTTKVDVLYKYGNGELKTSFTITVQ